MRGGTDRRGETTIAWSGVERPGLQGNGGIDDGGGDDVRRGGGVVKGDTDGDSVGNTGNQRRAATWGSAGQHGRHRESPLCGRR